MKILYLFPAFFFLLFGVRAQQLDSLKYPNGYLYYHTYGSGEPVIVLTGGPGNSCLQQQELAIELGKRYRSILLEQRGTGLSIPVPFDSTTINLRSSLEDLNRLMDHLGIRQTLFFGHSWGAMLAMCFAAKYPEKVKGLALACPGYYKFDPDLFTTHVNNMRVRLSIADLARLDSLDKKVNGGKGDGADSTALNRLMRMTYIYNKLLLDSMIGKFDVAKSNIKMQQLMVTDLKRVHYDLSKTLHHYKGPIEVISGAQDPLAFYTYEFKIIHPAMQLHWIQASGHFPMFEQRKDFYTTLSQVMKTLSRRQ
ncbi:alpha/beta fold hydrolase [Chitinophaga nivalis]|uniref:Alpha/beta hydrolase n=1 Tax=Chitinophaga nivalis TaxID=2991709 RepID=A0ABT3IR07_9BACT|nr:alpha/beta hydrolase [Chitinophaga nivalis]MCW3463905.1 alpha/beta hydrolase [Chitinophaga nivalis]MCW3486405.1 alpha/beta hydrolase [Chitinophaga nivalis]